MRISDWSSDVCSSDLPARGIVSLGATDMSRHWTGIALELAPTGALTRVDQRARLRLSQLGLNLIGLKSALVQALGLSLLLQLFAFAAPFYLQLAVAKAIPSPSSEEHTSELQSL